MKIINNQPNRVVLVGNPDLSVFFSYGVPVAAFIDGLYYRTSKFWSVTTSRHINEWLGDHQAEIKSQLFFEDLMNRRFTTVLP